MLQSSKIRFNTKLGYNELVEEKFDTLQNRVSIKYLNLDNGKFLSYYFKDGEQVSSLEFDGGTTYKLFGEGMSEPLVTEYDPLTLTPKFTVADRNDFYLRNLKYPSQARLRGDQGVVKLLHRIDINGKVKSREVVDAEEISPILQEEAIQLSELFDPKFYPLYSIYGERIEGFYIIHSRFSIIQKQNCFC